MNPGLLTEVYLGGAGTGEGETGFEKRFFFSGERHDAPVVVRVGVEAEDADPGDVSYRLDDAGDPAFVSTLTEVRDRLEEPEHASSAAERFVEVYGGAY